MKYRNFTYFQGVKILWKSTIAFSRNFHITKLDEMTVFYAVPEIRVLMERRDSTPTTLRIILDSFTYSFYSMVISQIIQECNNKTIENASDAAILS